YHANPREGLANYDFSLQHLPQYAGTGITYPGAPTWSRYALENTNFNDALAMLPQRYLSNEEVDRLLAFLEALTDRCAADQACYSAWSPNPEEDPDGHLLGADNGPAPVLEDEDVVTPEDYPDEVSLAWPAVETLSVFTELDNPCGPAAASNQQAERFLRRDGALGLTAEHGFNLESWSHGQRWINFEVTMIAG